MTLRYADPIRKPVRPPSPVVTPPGVLNGTAQTAAVRQMQVAGLGSTLRIVLGMDCIGAQVGPVWAHGAYLVVRCIWALGEAEGVQSYTINDQPAPAGTLATHYTGAAGQGIDPWLVAAGAAQSPAITYSDTLDGIAYSVFKLPAAALTSPPMFKAEFAGLKLYDPRSDTTAWTDNAGLALRAFLASSWGENKTITGGDVAVANRCDELCGIAPDQEARSRIGITLDARQPAAQWRDTLATYAECFVVADGAGYLMIPDAPASSEYSYDHGAGNLLALGSLKRAGTSNLPTVMTVYYTDRSVTPWRDIAIDPIKRPGVDAGTTPWRPQEIRLNGIFSAGQATRVATMRLNKLWLCDLSGEIHTLDDGMQVRPGTVVTLTDPRGITAKTVRVFGASGVDGRYVQQFIEHDDAAYSDVVIADPSTPDTTLPLPNDPPAVTGLAIVEAVAQMQTGLYGSRFEASWDATSYIYLVGYRVELWAGAQLVDSTTVASAAYSSPFLQEGINYSLRVATLSAVAQGEWAQDVKLAQGKQMIPGDVPWVYAFEAGGRVYASWGEAVDLDILRYDVRYGAVGGSFDTATDIDHVDALRLQTDEIPVGTWILYVKAEDSVRQYSANPATCSFTVTSDASAFLVDTLHQTNPALTNMAAFRRGRTDPNTYYVTEDGVIAATKFPAVAGTYGNIAATYHDSVTSTWLGEAEDFGLELGGQWTGAATVADVSGSHISYLGHSLTGSVWSYLTGLSQKVNARWARLKHEALTTSTMLVTAPDQNIRIEAVPRDENGSGTSSATNAVTVFLVGDYVATKELGLTPTGALEASAMPDNIGHNMPNPADKHANIVLDGNTITMVAIGWHSVRGRHPLPSTGKWRWRVKINNGGSYPDTIMIGVAGRSVSLTNTYTTSPTVFYAGWSGQKYVNGSGTSYGAAYTTGDLIGVAYDADLGKITFYKNGTSQGEITGLTGEYFPCFGEYQGDESITVQFTEADMDGWDVAGFQPLPYAFDVNIFNAGARVVRNFLYAHKGV